MDFWSTDSYCQAVDVDRRSDSRYHLFGKFDPYRVFP